MRGRVLVVNGSAELAALFAGLLQHAGYDTEVTTDPAEALARIRAEGADLVITSFPLLLPDGVQLVTRVRALAGPRIPFINLCAGRDGAEQHEAARAGVDVTLSLPVAPGDLLRAVEELLLRSRAGGPEATPP